MQTPKEYLRSIGIDVSGRGRMSAENVAKVKEAVASGVSIKGYATVSTPALAATTEESVSRTSGTGVFDIRPPLRDERMLTATAGGKEVGMRTVCQGCGNSLTYCPCIRSMVYVDHDRIAAVEFKQLNSPKPVRWW